MAAPDKIGDREATAGNAHVVRPASPVEAVKFETFIKITADGSITAYNGHVDLRNRHPHCARADRRGGTRRILCPRRRRAWRYVSGAHNQGATIASETIQITAVPLRKAAAQARQFLIVRCRGRGLELPLKSSSSKTA